MTRKARRTRPKPRGRRAPNRRETQSGNRTSSSHDRHSPGESVVSPDRRIGPLRVTPPGTRARRSALQRTRPRGSGSRSRTRSQRSGTRTRRSDEPTFSIGLWTLSICQLQGSLLTCVELRIERVTTTGRAAMGRRGGCAWHILQREAIKWSPCHMRVVRQIWRFCRSYTDLYKP